VNGLPYIASWNLTKRCNLSCPHCYIDSTADSADELTPQEAMFVVDELTYLNRKLMLVLSGGEPLLRDDLLDIVRYATEAGFIVVMGSNGTLLGEESLLALKMAGLKGLGVSVDSLQPRGHDAFRGTRGAWQASVEALQKARQMGIQTQMDVTLRDENWQDVEGFVELGVKLGVKAVNFFFLVCTGRAMGSQISVSHYERAIHRIADLILRERRTMVRARCAPHIYRVLHKKGYTLPAGTRGCLAGISYMRVDPQGNVTPCPYMPVVVGNLRQTSLRQIWEEAEVLRQLRKGIYGGRCGSCEYSEVCGGCRARAYAETGDLYGQDSLCGYEPSSEEKVLPQEGDEFTLSWQPCARERLRRVPPFIRRMVIRVIEEKARQKGLKEVTSRLIDEVKPRVRGHRG